MSTYTVEIGLGPDGSAPTHSWTIEGGDPADPMATSQILDGLTLEWGFPDSDVFPTDLEPEQVRFGLLLDDVSDLGDIGVGDIGNVRIESAGTPVAQFSGRIASATATPVRRKVNGVTVRKMLLRVQLVWFVTDLATIRISGDFPSESAADRWDRIAALVVAEGGPVINGNPGGVGTFIMAAAQVTEQPALGLLNDILKQVDTTVPGRGYLYPAVVDDTGNYSIARDEQNPALLPKAPGNLALVAHLLTLVFDGTAAAPAGLTIPSGAVVEEDMSYTALKYDTTTSVKVTGDFGTVVASNGFPGLTAVVDTSLVSAADGVAVAEMYLPDPDQTRWRLDAFTWLPSDADLAGLDYPLNVPSQLTAINDRRIRVAQVVIADIDTTINPGSDSTFYGGTLAGLKLTIQAGRVRVSGRIARRLLTASTKTATWDDLAANFPAVKWSVGVDVIDPTLSWYELALARKA